MTFTNKRRPERNPLLEPNFESNPVISDFLDKLQSGAAERERLRHLPRSEIREIAEEGLGSVRVSIECGGHGWSLNHLFRFIYALSVADPNIAHALRNHYLHVELLLTFPEGEWRNERLRRVVNGAILGGANSENHQTKMGIIDTSLQPGDSGYLLNGKKFYSTGSIFSDYVWVSATDSHGVQQWIDLPSTRDGITFVDDWDGFGQRLTGSGTTLFENVLVSEDDISKEDIMRGDRLPKQSVFGQLYMTTVVAGIVGNIAADAVELLRTRKRNYQHGSAERPQDDPLLLEQIGYLSSYAYAAKAAVEAAVPALARVTDAFHADEDFGSAGETASLAAANAKLTVDELALKAASLLLDVGGASATSEKLGLDRHWRNARTLSSHNPRVHKARGIGDHLVNEVSLPRNFF
ncbi:acyl-CoA dehydrogenase family protein [Paraburkholderia sp. RL17-347-BIC-D]|uniref:acyl-CoA dehydrogenase family protein n=1 Tax=Paraburkholderia sp. RL17-347-BIC-D TaxID=3031632 RepID=UPI0038BB12CF